MASPACRVDYESRENSSWTAPADDVLGGVRGWWVGVNAWMRRVAGVAQGSMGAVSPHRACLCTSRHLRTRWDRLCGHGPVLRLCTASRASCCSSTISPSKLAFTNHRDRLLGDLDTSCLQGGGYPKRPRRWIQVFFTQLRWESNQVWWLMTRS
ncbi:hypothetical protein B0H13DRAFT_1982623 [Mycena leptocephala]|nr:hypothetical protein B0H13DRAFT_1982623 [Mycena leptocephala]